MQIDERIGADDQNMYKNSFNGIRVNDATLMKHIRR